MTSWYAWIFQILLFLISNWLNKSILGWEFITLVVSLALFLSIYYATWNHFYILNYHDFKLYFQSYWCLRNYDYSLDKKCHCFFCYKIELIRERNFVKVFYEAALSLLLEVFMRPFHFNINTIENYFTSVEWRIFNSI